MPRFRVNIKITLWVEADSRARANAFARDIASLAEDHTVKLVPAYDDVNDLLEHGYAATVKEDR